jgi:hypothetical protein
LAAREGAHHKDGGRGGKLLNQGHIDYPRRQEVPPTFVAYGTSALERVVGILVGRDRPILVAGETLTHPCEGAHGCGIPLWAIRFIDVPDEVYTFYLLGAPGEVLDATLIRVTHHYDVSITSPKSGETVCTNCFASGQATNAGVATGTMTAGNGKVVNGTQVSPGKNWCLQFTGLDTTQTYTLAVTVGGDSSATPSTGVKVKNCTGG